MTEGTPSLIREPQTKKKISYVGALKHSLSKEVTEEDGDADDEAEEEQPKLKDNQKEQINFRRKKRTKLGAKRQEKKEACQM